jgi:uncharacterized protein with PIN domain
MPAAVFRFYAELNDFLSRDRRGMDIEVTFNGHETVKHLLESLGVPHTEVDVILLDGTSVDFGARLKDKSRVDIYPRSEMLGDLPIIRLRPDAPDDIRFILDGHLGRLASYLRLLGFDALYRNDYEDAELADISSNEGRILLTRDRGLLKRSQVQHGYCIRKKSPREQVVEVLQRLELTERARPFSRCARCNGKLIPVAKTDVFDRLEPKTKLYYDEFRICQDCDQVYWKGSHFERMESQLLDMLELSGSRE